MKKSEMKKCIPEQKHGCKQDYNSSVHGMNQHFSQV